MALLVTVFFGGLIEVDVAGGGLVMISDCWMVAVFCVRCCLGVSGRIYADGAEVSFSWHGGGRKSGVCLLVGLAAGAGWRGHSPAESAFCRLLSALSSCSCWPV